MKLRELSEKYYYTDTYNSHLTYHLFFNEDGCDSWLKRESEYEGGTHITLSFTAGYDMEETMRADLLDADVKCFYAVGKDEIAVVLDWDGEES